MPKIFPKQSFQNESFHQAHNLKFLVLKIPQNIRFRISGSILISSSLCLQAFVATGTNLSLQFFPANLHGDQRQVPSREYVDFERETGKVYLKAPMILNGVCVIWRGWIDLQRLDGMGYLEYDDERAQQEDALAQAAFEEARRRTRDFEDRDRSHREDLEVRRGLCDPVVSKIWD
uniref:Core-binding factor subunit beta n=1 Tax=Xiphophorus couchianus TaxID=32473 RepID=A0A3B5M162_9TELE